MAFVGLGRMGCPMCRHVCAAGYEVSAFDLDAGAVGCARPPGRGRQAPSAECASGAEMLVTSLPGPPEVEEVLRPAERSRR